MVLVCLYCDWDLRIALKKDPWILGPEERDKA